MPKRPSDFDLPPEKRRFAEEWLCHDVRTQIFRYLLMSDTEDGLKSFVSSEIFTISDMEKACNNPTECKRLRDIMPYMLDSGVSIDCIQQNPNWTDRELINFLDSGPTVFPSKIASMCRTLSVRDFQRAIQSARLRPNPIHAWMLLMHATRTTPVNWAHIAQMVAVHVKYRGIGEKILLRAYPATREALCALLELMKNDLTFQYYIYSNDRMEDVIWDALLRAIDEDDTEMATLIVATRLTIKTDQNPLLRVVSDEMLAVLMTSKILVDEYWREFSVSRIRRLADVGRAVKARFCIIS